ncbi:hypothetical protein A7U60_g2438 [Sanghuangporus baumii]|uniref:Uncharacterized protein n=1 Tax=Sanghuangporus baumii TaxID=108892 RepID=A0A9Q5I2A5_SANBA|nr:hypothetical protein A7U60_g2438 [Sanghuangporus baumii]
MDYQALRDRFYNSALKYSSLLSEHYGPSSSYDLRRTSKSVDQLPRATLPLELVQYIVALAFSERDLSYLRKASEDRGVESLLTFEYLAHDALLASTTFKVRSCCPYDGNPKWESFDDPQLQIPGGRLRVELLGTITVHNECGPVLPHLRYFAFELRSTSKRGSQLGLAGQSSGIYETRYCKLRSALIPGPFVEEFISSSYLRNISRLTIELARKEQTINEWPSPDEVLKMLPELTNLVSLTIGSIYPSFSGTELGTTTDLMSYDTDRLYHSYSNGLHPELPPLRQLRIDIEWDIALPFISKLASYDLKELAIFDFFFLHLKGDKTSCNKLSGLFPNLKALRFPTVNFLSEPVTTPLMLPFYNRTFGES